MGHDQDAAVELAEELLEQHLRAQVEEVRRLVEDQQVGIVQQQGRELHARLPAAGERAHGLVQHDVGQLELPGDFAAPPVGLAAVADEEVENRFAFVKRIVLTEVAEAELLAARDFAGVELFVAQAARGRGCSCRRRCGR